jgi:hypothetical protein
MQQQAPRKPEFMPHTPLICGRRVHTNNRRNKVLIVALTRLGQQPPLHLARGGMLHATGHFRRLEQLLDCRELHLLCRWVNSIAKCRGAMGGNV